MPNSKPSYKTQELQKSNLSKFLKRVSTPVGTDSSKGQVTPKNSHLLPKKKDKKVKSKSKKPPAIILSGKRPTTQPTSSETNLRGNKMSALKSSSKYLQSSSLKSKYNEVGILTMIGNML